ncbi:L-fucose:H+ symporter permease [Flavobacterium hibernum]|uniref:Fucose permease n=1 Tax=Flavobacterium hibernum TaxID=37752 RepID=A0A0D0EVD6_9FLAO|nr:L-fucose:H+ symporter permease [Flavobacterium hibernum]KIO50856.1 fucose permease [Flavobacterium hibernum]OXA90100.1 L-fucose:H+ symporter permease [Flavobacterium hibernum]PTS90825.1 L-fucose:H+ symporter permease [Flavobacterium sp. HMWF030]STO18593.1 L-fucose permease [Flavobacterium hibernum]
MQITNQISDQNEVATEKVQGNKYLLPFILITSLFFLWGMAHGLDGILIPHLKKACQLNNRQSTLIDTAIFFAYFIMAIPAGIIIKKIGYKNSIITGLLVFAAGAFLFVPAANTRTYELFLLALFIIGCGLTILETSANPYAAILGPAESSSKRLNLAASFNGLAVTLAPLLGGVFILSGVNHTPEQLAAMTDASRAAYLLEEASSVKLPYIILGTVLVLVAILFYFMHLPSMKSQPTEAEVKPGFFSVLKFKHLSWAVVAQFFYVGAQVCITSFFIRIAQKGAGLDEKTAAYYLTAYGFLFMVGRFSGTFFLKFVKDYVLLSIYAVCSILLCLVAIYGTGIYVIYALGGIGFFMSIMFPTIFSLGLVGLKSNTETGSSWLVMSIVGGAILPYGMGTLIDMKHDDIQAGYIIPLLCFVIILYFGVFGHKVKTVK